MEIPVDALAVVVASFPRAYRIRRARPPAGRATAGVGRERRPKFLARVATVVSAALFGAAIGSAGAAVASAGGALDRDEALRASTLAVNRVPRDYALTRADGRRMRLSDFRGRPLLVSFVYTGCTQVCPAATAFLIDAVSEAQRALGTDAFNVLTIGFNLPFDNPQAMRVFARTQGIDRPGWTAASPDAGDVAQLTRDFGFSYAATPAGFDHIAQVTVVDGSGRIAGQVYGDSFALPMLIGPLKALVSGTPLPDQSGLAAIVERVRLWCTVYDPRSGRYRLDYGLVFELVAGISVLGATALFVASGRRRRRG